jgi:hypothetical protein
MSHDSEGRSAEPAVFRRGKAFHRLVQGNWARTVERQPVRIERSLALGIAEGAARPQRRGRMDIFVDQTGDFVTVVEIKSTDWNRIRPANRRRLLASHCRQVYRYVDTYLDRERVKVCAGIIYPKPPRQPDVRAEVEEFLNERALQVVWYDE